LVVPSHALLLFVIFVSFPVGLRTTLMPAFGFKLPAGCALLGQVGIDSGDFGGWPGQRHSGQLGQYSKREVYMASKPVMDTTRIPLELSKQLRTLAHDLSNSIETIMQASYLLGQAAALDDTNKKWVELIDNAARDAARINREIREILRNNSVKA
jgi:signal transduction histidine kinase